MSRSRFSLSHEIPIFGRCLARKRGRKVFGYLFRDTGSLFCCRPVEGAGPKHGAILGVVKWGKGNYAPRPMRYPVIDWIKYITLLLASMFFLFLGVDLFVASYALDNPLTFIVSFFAASLIVLIAIVGAVYCVLRMPKLQRLGRGRDDV